MTNINKKILNTLLAIDIGILIFCMLSGHKNWLYTTQIGFFTSSLVIFASMASYRNMIQKRIEYGVDRDDGVDRDEIDKIDDPYDLYDEETKPEERELTREEFVEVVDEERAKQKAQKRSISEVLRDSRAFLSFYRLGAYALLILGFFYLNRHGYLHIPSYFFALSVPPVIVVIALMREGRRGTKEEGALYEKS
ncbi:MAG: hypothetical protein DRG30_08090 [Epsilonproteobacteria bacterium]|nr:MAG: hypothetical protein DRG30_08090 [Campylobacterota bacterium]